LQEAQLISTPCRIEGLRAIVSICALENESACADIYGNLWVLRQGLNQIQTQNPIKSVHSAVDRIMILDTQGISWSISFNTYGYWNTPQEHWTQSVAPKQELEDVTAIASGKEHFILIDSKGFAYGWGMNNKKQLGLWKRRVIITQMERGPNHGIFGSTSKREIPTRIRSLNKIVLIACGFYHSFFVTTENVLFACGQNDFGQLGVGHKEECCVPEIVQLDCGHITKIFASESYSIVVDEEASWLAGRDTYNFLGKNGNIFSEVPVISERFTKMEEFSKISQFACSDTFGILKEEGHADFLVFGENDKGQLGLGHTNLIGLAAVQSSASILADAPAIRRKKSARK